MEKLKAIIIDDELSSLQNLQQKLTEFCPDVAVIESTQKPEEAIALIQHYKPDVIFLDIEMPRMNGFRMLDNLKNTDFEIIFTTAYNYYAIDAIRISAFDYLTKPIAIADLQNAVQRLLALRQQNTKEKVEILKAALSDKKNQEDKIAIPTSGGIEFVTIKNIIHIESSSNYSKIYLADGKNLLVTKLLKDFEDMLLPYHFYRIHNSHLINLNHIQKYIKADGGQVMMNNRTVIDISRRKKDEFLKIIGG